MASTVKQEIQVKRRRYPIVVSKHQYQPATEGTEADSEGTEQGGEGTEGGGNG